MMRALEGRVARIDYQEPAPASPAAA